MRIASAAVAFIVLCAIALVIWCFAYCYFNTTRHSPGYDTCQHNMKELALAFTMYMGENNGMLPSSAITGASDRVFRSTLGRVKPRTFNGYKPRTIFEVARMPFTWRGIETYFCPMDPVAYRTTGILWWKRTVPRPVTSRTPTSYVLKKAINDAWLDPKIKARRVTDFKWPAEQLLFYERRSFHWGDTSGDLSDPRNRSKVGASFNCAFIDGHVKTHRIPDMFEPDYYNVDANTGAPVKKPQIDPRLYCDRLQ